jgi:sec-independent protein translocase protein TatB
VLDIGAGELVALAVIALIVLGPDKLPRYAADAARFIRQIRKMANDARAEVTKELGPELGGLGLKDINPRALVRKHVLEGTGLDDLGLSDLNLDDDPPRTNGSSRRPGAANGSAANGSAANGSAANGSAASGSAADGSPEPQRPAFDPDTT